MTVSTNGKFCSLKFYMKSPFFKNKEKYVFKVKNDILIVSRPTLDYIGKEFKAYLVKNGGGWVLFGQVADLAPGKYAYCSEESDIDKEVYIINEQI